LIEDQDRRHREGLVLEKEGFGLTHIHVPWIRIRSTRLTTHPGFAICVFEIHRWSDRCIMRTHIHVLSWQQPKQNFLMLWPKLMARHELSQWKSINEINEMNQIYNTPRLC
jgi:hypothetical protein